MFRNKGGATLELLQPHPELSYMTDTNTLQALLMAAGMATAGGVIFEEPASIDSISALQAPKTSLAQYAAKFDLQLLFAGRKQ